MKLQYTAVNLAGTQVHDSIEAESEADATEQLRGRGLFVLDFGNKASRSNAVTIGVGLSRGKALALLVGFTRELSVLLQSGSPLADALAALERQAAHPVWKEVMGKLRQGVEEGQPLSTAMEHFPQYFDPVCRGLIAAGEQSGGFQQVLQRLATLVRRQLHVRRAVLGAMIYPCMLMSIAVVVMVLMLVYVLPSFGGMFDSLDTPMPPSTAVLMDVSAFLRSYGLYLLGAIVAAIVGIRLWMISERGRATIDHWVLHAPVIGQTAQALCVARLTRVLGMLLAGKVDLVEALRLTRLTSGNAGYQKMLDDAQEAVTGGGSLSGAMSDSGLMPPSLCEAVRNGEQSGRLGDLLLGVSDFLDEENETAIRSLSKTLEPIILIFLGLFVGFVVVSMFLPLFDLTAVGGAP